MYKVITELLYDRYNPERVFKKNEILKVNDPERARNMLARGLVMEVADQKDYIELDPSKTLDDLTIKELKKLADEKNIEYDAKIKKDELIDLLK